MGDGVGVVVVGDAYPPQLDILRYVADCPFSGVQSWPKKFVLGCVIPPAGAVARSLNLGQTFLANSVGKRTEHSLNAP